MKRKWMVLIAGLLALAAPMAFADGPSASAPTTSSMSTGQSNPPAAPCATC